MNGIEKLISRYFDEAAGANANTLRAKKKDLEYFVEFVRGEQSFSRRSIEGFLNWRLGLELPSSANRRLANVKHFVRFVAESEGLPDCTRHVKPVAIGERAPAWLTLSERTALDIACKKASLRDALVIQLQRRCGLRRAEIVCIRLSQIDLAKSRLRNVKRKGNKFQDIFYPETVAQLLRQRLATGGEYVIESDSGRTISVEQIYAICQRIGFRARIAKLNPHRLRHTFIREIYESTKDLRLAADAAGHSDVRVTMRYTGIREDELRAAILGLK